MSLPHAPAELPGRTAGQSIRSVAGYGVLVALMLISPLFVFVPAALFQCGTRNGKRVVWPALAIGIALAVLVTVPSAHAPGAASNDVMMASSYLLALVLAIAVPAMIVLPRVSRGEAFGRVLMIALVASVIGLFATELVMRVGAGISPYADIVAKLRDASPALIGNYEKAGFPADAIS